MLCPYCGSSELKVVDKRSSSAKEIRRRRECLKCKKRFTTYESIKSVELFVIKKDGRLEPFDRSKLRISMMKACEKRPISIKAIDDAVSSIEVSLLAQKTKEVKTRLIGELVMKHLKKLDKVAYIRFASVYKEFKDLEDFHEELKKIKK